MSCSPRERACRLVERSGTEDPRETAPEVAGDARSPYRRPRSTSRRRLPGTGGVRPESWWVPAVPSHVEPKERAQREVADPRARGGHVEVDHGCGSTLDQDGVVGLR